MECEGEKKTRSKGKWENKEAKEVQGEKEGVKVRRGVKML